MSAFLEYIPVSIAALLPGIGGAGLVAWLLPGERRLPVILGGGLAAGNALVIFALMALLRVIPMPLAVLLVFAATLPGAAYFGLRVRRGGYVWNVATGWTVLGLSALGLVSAAAVVDLSSSVWNGATHENLVVRMAMAAHGARGDWPVMDPYSPDHQRLYRHAAQAWTSGLMRISGAGLYPATVVVVVGAVWGIAGGLFAALARLRTYLAGFLGAALFMMAAPANFLGIWKSPFASLSDSRAYGLALVKREILQGYLLGHGFALAPGNDFTMVVGLGAGAGAAFLATALTDSRARRRTAVVLAAMALAAAGAAAEQVLPVIAAVLLAVASFWAIRRRWQLAVALVTVVGLGAVLVVIPEGTYGALVFGSDVGQRASFAFTPELFLRLPTEYFFYAGSESKFFAVPAETLRVWLFDPIALKELGWIYVAIVALAVVGWRRRTLALWPVAMVPLVALLVPGVFSDRLYEINIARFTVFGISLGGLAAGVAAAELYLAKSRGAGLMVGRILAAGLILFASASWFLAIPLWPARLSEQPYPNLAEDLEAAEVLRSLDYGRRALLLPGPTNKEEVNTDGWEGMHRFVVSFGATSIPMGLDHWGASHLYQPNYLLAYNSIDPAAMAELGIDTIYVAPLLLDEAQEARLAEAVLGGRASLIFESSAGHRRVYAYDSR